MILIEGKDFGLRDIADNQILETAIVGNCNFLISGDKDLLVIKRYQDIKIVKPAQFLSKWR